MPTAHLLTGGVLDETDPVTGQKTLARALGVDLGQRMAFLEAWAVDRKLADRVYYYVFSTAIWIPAGLKSNGPGWASIPGWLQSFIMGDKDNYACAAVLHDALYQWQAPRDDADRVFWIVAASGNKHVGAIRAWFGWAAVRALGGRAYNRYRS